MQLVIAAHSSPPSREVEEKAKKFIDELAKCGKEVTLLLGGYWGLMKVVVDEAIRLGMKVVIVLPIEKEDVELPEGVIRINSGCEYRCRSVILVRSGDVLVSLGGGSGTMIEMLTAYAMGIPVFALVDTGMYSDRLARAFPDYFDERNAVRVNYFVNPEEMAKAICSLELKKVRTSFG